MSREISGGWSSGADSVVGVSGAEGSSVVTSVNRKAREVLAVQKANSLWNENPLRKGDPVRHGVAVKVDEDEFA